MKLIHHEQRAQRPGLIARYELEIVQLTFVDHITDRLLLKYYRTEGAWGQTLMVLQELDISIGAVAIESAGRTA